MTDFVNEFKQQKEYKDFSVILHASTGRQKPIMVCGLCEGAELAFLESLLTESDGKKGALFLAPDEKKVRRLTDALTADGYRVLPYLYREPVLHNITGSHDFEYEHLRVLASLLDGKFDAVLATPDAAMQYTIPPARLRDASFSLTADCGITKGRRCCKGWRRRATTAVSLWTVRGSIPREAALWIFILPPRGEPPGAPISSATSLTGSAIST